MRLFVAGILHSLGTNGAQSFNNASEKDIKEALRLGQALAAFKCGYGGARGVMYAVSKNELEREVQRILTHEEPLTFREGTETGFREVLQHICPRCIENRSSLGQ